MVGTFNNNKNEFWNHFPFGTKQKKTMMIISITIQHTHRQISLFYFLFDENEKRQDTNDYWINE